MRVYLKKVNPKKNQYRFYSLCIAPTLFGEWALMREWGRLGQGGTCRTDWFTSKSRALEALKDIKEKKIKKGYQ